MRVKAVINDRDVVVAYGPDEEGYEPAIPENCKMFIISEEELADRLRPTPAQQKVAELAALSQKYKEDSATLQLGMLSIMVAGGASGDSKKVLLRGYVADLKTQYSADKAAIVAKYA